MGYNSEIGWCGEAAYGTAAATTVDAGAGGSNSFFFDSFGIVTDFNLSAVVERYNAYGAGSQTRIADGILKETYELTVTCLWQDDSSRGTIKRFLEEHEDGTYDSYLIRIMAIPGGGATEEYAYLIGCVLRNYSVKVSIGDVVSVELTFSCQEVDSDNWQTLAGEDYTYVLGDLHVAADLGLQGDITADILDNSAVEGQSSSASDDGNYILWIGRDTDDSTWRYEFSDVMTNPAWEPGADGRLWSGTNGANEPTYNIVGAALVDTNNIATCIPQTAVGTITVRAITGAAEILQIAAGASSSGLYFPDVDNPINAARVGDEVLYAVGDSANVNFICMVGTNTSDAVITEEIELNGTTPVASATAFRTVRIIALGDLAAADSVRIYGTVAFDPTAYHECTIDFPGGLVSIDNELQDFSIDESFNPAEIWNFTDSALALAGDSAFEETKFSGTVYGDDTSMGVGDIMSVMIADASAAIVFQIGSYWEFNLAACSYDSISYPLKEKELIIMDFEGTMNSMTLDSQ